MLRLLQHIPSSLIPTKYPKCPIHPTLGSGLSSRHRPNIHWLHLLPVEHRRTPEILVPTLEKRSFHSTRCTPTISLLQSRHRPIVRKHGVGVLGLGVAPFHSTPRNQSVPLILPLIAGLLKSSAAIELVRTAARITLTFVPALMFKMFTTKRYLKVAEYHGVTPSAEKQDKIARHLVQTKLWFRIFLFTPVFIFWATIMASLERTPLTGRWRMIILSPEEEDQISSQLAGLGWYQAVCEILAKDGPPRLVAADDWRYSWVRDTLRRLESTIPILQQMQDTDPAWLDGTSIPLPPPADFPLRPRPRATEYLRGMCDSLCDRTVMPAPHAIAGPPYSLLIVDNPDASNAFSYGFGPDGGGGIVVYSGFLDEVLSRVSMAEDAETSPPPPTDQGSSWWSVLLGGFLPQSSSSSRPNHPIPTTDQTAELAVLLAHELSHLILSHHLETLSSGTVIIPGILSMFSDVVRVLLFPFTMIFGPFVNDAFAQLGKVGSSELLNIGEFCTSMKQEIEADVVSARLLANAGFDAREAVTFWENRKLSSKTAECSVGRAEEMPTVSRRIMGSGHPVNEVRVDKLKAELVRWETERRAALVRLQSPREESSSSEDFWRIIDNRLFG